MKAYTHSCAVSTVIHTVDTVTDWVTHRVAGSRAERENTTFCTYSLHIMCMMLYCDPCIFNLEGIENLDKYFEYTRRLDTVVFYKN